MVLLFAVLAALVLMAVITKWLQRRMGAEGNVVGDAPADCASCGGSNGKCEQECMMEAATKEIVYFDDEELDEFKGRESDSYSDDEAALFEEVMCTMRQEEVKDWCRSLNLRGISLPDQLKDEAIMLIEN